MQSNIGMLGKKNLKYSFFKHFCSKNYQNALLEKAIS
jgi:hypothetical protein